MRSVGIVGTNILYSSGASGQKVTVYLEQFIQFHVSVYTEIDQPQKIS